MFTSFRDVSVLEPVYLGLSFPGLRQSKGMTGLEKADKVLVWGGEQDSRGQQTNIFGKETERPGDSGTGGLDSSPGPPFPPGSFGFGAQSPHCSEKVNGGVRRRR